MTAKDDFFAPAPCVLCGKETTRKARVDRRGRIDPNAPLQPVCDGCGPKYEAIAILKDGKEIPIEPMPMP